MAVMRAGGWATIALFAGLVAGAHGDDVEGAILRLRAGDAQARWEAARALARAECDITSAETALVAASFDEDALVRRAALRALGRLGEPAVGWIVVGLSDVDVEVRVDAARTLGSLGVRGALAVPALLRALEHGDIDVRVAAVRALGEIGVPAGAARQALLELRKVGDPELDLAIAKTLGRIAAAAVEGLGGIVDESPWPASSDSEAATEPDVDRRVADAILELGSPRFSTREAAAASLLVIGAPAEPALRAALHASDSDVRSRAKWILAELVWRVAPDTPAPVVEAIERARAQTGWRRRAAVEALLRAGPVAHRAALAAFRSESDGRDRGWLARDLVRVDGNPVHVLIAAGRFGAAAALLDELAATRDEEVIRAYASFHRVRGTIDREIERQLAKPDGAARVAWLHRAAGRSEPALAAARAAGDPELIRGLLVDRREWAAAIAVATPDDAERMFPSARDAGQLGLIAELAGDGAVRDRALGTLRRAEAHDRGEVFEALIELGERERAVNMAADSDGRDWITTRRTRWLIGEGRYAEALARLEPSRAGQAIHVRRERARLLRRLGHPADARAELVQIAETSNPTEVLERYEVASAIDDCADLRFSILVRCCPAGTFEDQRAWAEKLYGARGRELRGWWDALRDAAPGMPSFTLLPRVISILDGRLPTAHIVALARCAAARGAQFEQLVSMLTDCWRERRVATGLDVLEAAIPPGLGHADDWLTLGRISRFPADWVRVERAYRRVAEERPWSLEARVERLLALARLGRADLADTLVGDIERMALSNDLARMHLADAEDLLGRVDAARSRYEAALDAQSIQPFVSGERACQWLRADAADDPAALERWVRRAEIVHVRSPCRFLESYDYRTERVLARARRALVLGQAREAQKLAEQVLAGSPHNIEAHALRVAADPATAGAILAAEHAYYDGLVALHPDSALVHRRRAWFCARTRTRLDDGLVSADRACALEPDTMRNLAVLAEVRFQRGDRPGAVAAATRGRDLGDRGVFAARQLARLREGTPTTDPPCRAEPWPFE